MNPTYDKMKNKLINIEMMIREHKADINRYMPNGITGHEWEYISMAKDLINEIEKELIR